MKNRLFRPIGLLAVTVIFVCTASSCILFNTPPIAIAGADREISVGEQTVLDGTNSVDTDADPLSYLWNVTPPPDVSVSQFTLTNNTQSVAYLTPNAPGLYLATLTVDDGMATHNDTVRISVVVGTANNAPEVTIDGGDVAVASGATATFTTTASDPDDGDTLTYAWFVDGTEQAGETADSFSFSDTPATQTDYEITVEVTDSGSLTAADTVILTIYGPDNNAPTVTVNEGDQMVANGATATFTASAADPDGDPWTYRWYVDGVEQIGETTASFSYSDSPGATTNYTVLVEVTDDGGLTGTDQVTLTILGPGNNPPSVTITEGDQTVAGGVTATFTADATDPDVGDVLSYQWYVNGVQQAGQTAGTFDFSDTPGSMTNYTILVEVTDDGGLADTAEVILTILSAGNNPPSVTILEGDQTVANGVPASFNAMATDPDVGDVLSYKWFVDGVEQAGETGTSFTFSDTPGSTTNYTVLVEVTDDGTGPLSGTDQAILTILSAGNNPPTVTITEGDQTVSNGANATFTAVATDPDFDGLSYKWFVDGVEQAGETGTSFAYSASPGATTNYTVLVEVTDDGAGALTATDQVTLTILGPSNSAPSVTITEGDQITAAGVAATFTADATDPDAGDSLSYKWFLDGIEQAGETASTLTITLSPGTSTTYLIAVEVSDLGSLTATDSAFLDVVIAATEVFSFDGGAWQPGDSPGDIVVGMASIGSTIYALRDTGALMRFDGVAWLPDETAPANSVAIGAVDTTLYAFTDDGTLYSRGGAGVWTVVAGAQLPGAISLAGVGGNLYALTVDDTVWQLGGVWTVDDSTGPASMTAITAVGTTLYAVTTDGSLYQRDGVWRLEAVQPPTGTALVESVEGVLYVVVYTAI